MIIAKNRTRKAGFCFLLGNGLQILPALTNPEKIFSFYNKNINKTKKGFDCTKRADLDLKRIKEDL